MHVIRWYHLGPELLVCYEGVPEPAEARLLGVTLATADTLRVMGELLVLWHDSLDALDGGSRHAPTLGMPPTE